MKQKKTGDENHVAKIMYPGQEPKRIECISRTRFLHSTGQILWDKNPSVYLRVSYGKQKDNFGKTQTFFNDGDYTNKKDFDLAIKAFCKEECWV